MSNLYAEVIVGATGASGGTNAGTTAVNGAYLPSGTYNSVTQFTNGTYYLAWSGSVWKIYSASSGGGSVEYTSTGGSSSSIPTASSSWSATSGATPAPTLAIVTTSLPNSLTTTNSPGTSGCTGTWLPVAGANAIFVASTQYSNGTNYLTYYQNYWLLETGANIGGSTLYEGAGTSTSLPLSGWTPSSGASPAPTFSATYPGVGALTGNFFF